MWAAMRPLLVLVIAFGIAISEAGRDSLDVSYRKQEACPARDPLMNPTHEVRYGQDVVWQIPPNPRGILFIAHGYCKGPFSFFDQTPNCQKCNSLPEDRSIALEALRRGYALIAVKSVADGFNFTQLDTSQDLVNVMTIINDWRREQSLDTSLPFSAFGSSSGGFFINILATKMPIRALLLMTSEGLPELVETATRETFPPTFFVYMNSPEHFYSPKPRAGSLGTAREMTSRAAVEKSIAILSERGVRVGGKLCLPSPITPLYFTQRLPCTSDEISTKMQRAYKSEGWLNSSNYLVVDPYLSDWLIPLGKWKSQLPLWYVPTLECPEDAVCQELLRAWAFHVITGDANEEMFSFLDSILMGPDDDHLISDSR